MDNAIKQCPTLLIAHILGKKWVIPILEDVYFSRTGVQFNSLKRSLGSITSKTLSKSLDELCNESILKKKEVKTNDISFFEYRLTKKGKAVRSIIKNFKELGICWYNMKSNCSQTKCASCSLFSKSLK